MKRQLKLLILAMMVVFLFGSMTVQASEFTMSQTKATVNVGDVIDLDITGTDKVPHWTSWNVNTAKVNQNGVVTAVRKGKTFITARVGLSYQKCTITVVEPTIKLDKKAATIFVDDTSANTVQLKATAKGASKDVTWTSSNPDVAIVDKSGKVTSVAEGSAVITATANGKSASTTITVKKSAVRLNASDIQLSTKGTGSVVKLVPSVVGPKKNVTWTTSDKNIATVVGGKVAGKKNGTAVITATANGVAASCNVTVVDGLLSIGEENVSLYAGETLQLKSNADATNAGAWSCSDTSVADVSEDGTVTAKKAGTAIVSLKGTKTVDTCLVVVKDVATSIREDSVELQTKGLSKTYTLGYDVVGRKPAVKFTTSDKTIVAVTNKGKLTAKKAGTAVITATANGISDTVQVSVKEYTPTIKLNQEEYTLYTNKGNVFKLKATVDGPSKKVEWASTNPDVAIVINGKVTALKSGQTLIKATANGVIAECLINVKSSEVLLETNHIHLKKGGSGYIPADVVGQAQSVKYVTSNPKVAAVKNGIVTAKNNGVADIKVTANGVTSICSVYVADCDHKPGVSTIVKEPTCMEEGTVNIPCTLCDHVCVQPIPVIDHTWREAARASSTCIESGVVTYSCKYCDELKHELLELSEHTWGEWQTVIEATEDAEGVQKRICVVCQAEETQAIPKKDHKHQYSEEVVEPTCTEDGYTLHTCECGDSYTDTKVDATGHTWGEWQTVTEATEDADGLEKRSCSVCEAEETQAIPKKNHEHQYSEEVVEPTCTEKGYTTYTCACGDSYTDTVVDALGHSWGEWSTVTEATEEADGLKKHTCSVCEAEETQAIPKKDHVHEYIEKVVAPTCTKEGYTSHECACGDIYMDTYIDAVGHTVGEWVTITEPTCTEEGLRRFTCACGESYSETVEAKGHSYSSSVTNPTCEEQGFVTFTCACGDSYVDNYIDALGHAGDVLKVYAPTCIKEGYTLYKCNKCQNNYKDKFEDALGHSWGNWEIVTEATEEAEGKEKRICSVCQEKETQPIPKIVYEECMLTVEDFEKIGIVDENEFGELHFTEDVVIPETFIFDGTHYKVTSLSENLFRGFHEITSVVIPDTVTSIGAEAFRDCQNLVSVTMSKNVVTIGERAFSGCENLSVIVLPENIETVGSRAFWNVPMVVYDYDHDGRIDTSDWGAIEILTSAEYRCVQNGHDWQTLVNGGQQCSACGRYRL